MDQLMYSAERHLLSCLGCSTLLSDPNQQLPPHHFIWQQQTDPVPKAALGIYFIFPGKQDDNFSYVFILKTVGKISPYSCAQN